jgi:protein-disulfide isomerase
MTMSKREAIRAQRQRRKRQQRITTILVISGIVLVLAALFISPYVVNALRPVGAIATITPFERPLVDGRAMGNPDAPVVVEVFEDFQCPNCKGYSDNAEKSLVESDYITSGQVYYVFRQFPFIDSNLATQESHQAANASMCAAEQGRFWDYHDMLFTNWSGENEGAFTDQRLTAFAEALNLDMKQFNACFKGNLYKSQIDSDLNIGQKYGVHGTPSVFVNGVAVRPGYVPTYDDLKQAIDAALAVSG